jgi:hypothetical protein
MPRKRRRFRLPLVRHPHDASHEFDDASYDGGTSGGAYLKHIVVVVVVIIVVITLLRLL